MVIGTNIDNKVREGLELLQKGEFQGGVYGGEPALKTQKPRPA